MWYVSLIHLSQPFQTFLRHLINILFAAFKELEEDTDGLCFDFYYVVVHAICKAALIVHDHIILIILLRLIVELIQSFREERGKIIVRNNIAEKLHALAYQRAVQANIWKHLV